MYQFTQIEQPWQVLPYRELIFPCFRSRLLNLQPDGAVIAIAAHQDQQPVGLILAERRASGPSAEILSWVVRPRDRQQGVGTALLQYLEQTLIARGCSVVELAYVTGHSTTPQLEKILQTEAWSVPRPQMLICQTTMEKVQHAPWLQKRWRKDYLSDRYTLFPWREITAADRQKLQQTQATQPWIPPDLVPFDYEEKFEPINSLGLRYQGEVVGWLITHRTKSDTIRYTCGYTHPVLQRLAPMVAVYAHAAHLQLQAGVPQLSWTVPYIHTGQVNFIIRHLQSYATFFGESLGVFKQLRTA